MRDYEDLNLEQLTIEKKRLKALREEFKRLIKEVSNEIEKIDNKLCNFYGYELAILRTERKNLKRTKKMFKNQIDKLNFEIATVQTLLNHEKKE